MAFGGSTKRLFIQIGLDIGRALHPLNILRNGFNLLRSTLVATFRTSVIGGFFAAMRAGFQTIANIQQSVGRLVGEMAQLQLAAIKTASVASEGGEGFASAFQQASNVARELSTQVNFTAGEIQEGLFTAAQAGYDLNQALGFTQSALMLAATSGEGFQEIMNDMIGITRAFGIEMSNVPQLADAIAGAAQKSKVSVQGLFEGLKNVASVANTTFGESVETFQDMTAALMTLNDAGIENSTAGVKMRAALQQLNSGTAKTTAVFAKYGINIFKTNSENQRFVDTLMKSQRAFEGYDEKLNELKNRQLEMVTAGQQGSDEYNNVTKEIDALTEQISILEQGMDRVEGQFKLAGGQLKPFHELLQELQKAPKEAIGRAFGIRGGESILRLLQNAKNFEENRQEVQRFMEESEKGVSILQRVYDKFFSSILVRWQVIKNEVIGIFSVIADAAFGAFGKLLDPIEMGLKHLFQQIQDNQGIFKAIFEGIAQLLSPITAQVGIVLAQIGEMMEEIFMPGARVTLPITKFNKETGTFDTEDKTLGGDATVAEKLALAMESAVSVFTAGLQRGIQALDPFIEALGKPFAEGLSAFLFAKTSIFIKLGAFVATGFIETFKLAMEQYLPQIMNFIGTEFRKLIGGIRIGGKKFGFNVSAADTGSESPAAAGETKTPSERNTAIEDAMFNGFAGMEEESASGERYGTPYGGFSVNPNDFGVDMSELNKAGTMSENSAKGLEAAGDKMVAGMANLENSVAKLNQKLDGLARSQSRKETKGI